MRAAPRLDDDAPGGPRLAPKVGMDRKLYVLVSAVLLGLATGCLDEHHAPDYTPGVKGSMAAAQQGGGGGSNRDSSANGCWTSGEGGAGATGSTLHTTSSGFGGAGSDFVSSSASTGFTVASSNSVGASTGSFGL